MTDETRPYRKRRRAESEAQTRLRITESTVELHGTVGPSRTSISAVAERAGVRRSTVYRHFPDEASLFEACTAHWMRLNPPPDPGNWVAIADSEQRVQTALEELYGYYRRNAQMMENLHRDEATVPLVKHLFSGFRDYLATARDTLDADRQKRARAADPAAAAIGHALAFHTWHSLAVEQGLDDAQAADLMHRLIIAARDLRSDGQIDDDASGRRGQPWR